MANNNDSRSKIIKRAKEDYLMFRESGHYPDFLCDGPLSDEDLEREANENDMTVDEFKIYLDCLYSLIG